MRPFDLFTEKIKKFKNKYRIRRDTIEEIQNHFVREQLPEFKPPPAEKNQRSNRSRNRMLTRSMELENLKRDESDFDIESIDKGVYHEY